MARPFGRAAVVIERAGLTVMDRDCVAVWAVGLVLSVTFAVKVEVPVVVGVPLMAPFAASVKPVGRAPVAIIQVYGEVPPEAVSVWE